MKKSKLPYGAPNSENVDKYYLYPGEIFSSRTPYIVDTVLGSCVAVFLWDAVFQFSGINHYMLPSGGRGDIRSCKYGNVAIPELVKRMLKMGSNKNNIRAKIFGGSETSRPDSVFNIGERNILIARKLLDSESIPVVSESVGGTFSRKVVFNTASGEVFINFIRKKTEVIDSENKKIAHYNIRKIRQ